MEKPVRQPCRINYTYEIEYHNDTLELVEDSLQDCAFTLGKVPKKELV